MIQSPLPGPENRERAPGMPSLVARIDRAAPARLTPIKRALPYAFPTAAALMAIVAMVAGGEDPCHYFREGHIVTWLNSLQILACSVIGASITRSYWPPRRGNKKVVFWLIVTLASAYLAVDEVAQLHETHGPLVSLIRYKWDLGPQVVIGGKPLLSLGDLFELGYGVLAFTLCLYYRQEILRKPSALRLYLLGTAFLLFSFAWDFVLLEDLSLWGHHISASWMLALEDGAKFVGFGAILGGFVFRLTRQ